MGKGRSPRGDCDKDPVILAEGSAYSIGTVEHPYLASIESSSGISQYTNVHVGELIDELLLNVRKSFQ